LGEGDGFYDDVPELSYGTMVHGITYADEAYPDRIPETEGNMCVRLWQPKMKKGVIEFIPPWECQHKVIHNMSIKSFGNCNLESVDMTESEVMV
jgi:CRISPR-associated protein Cas5d